LICKRKKNDSEKVLPRKEKEYKLQRKKKEKLYRLVVGVGVLLVGVKKGKFRVV
jgi:hypothetical protein